ncbi:MAG: alcohol dehydrogenase catalytic domain-containing protein [Nocardioides sp.]
MHAPKDLRVEDVPTPHPAADQALVSVTSVGLCGTDLEEYAHGPVTTVLPVTLGHEVVGVVAEPAADGSGPPAGTRVVVDVVTGCGHCWWCQQHDEGKCPDLVVTGLDVDGGLAEYVAGRAERLIAVPDGLDPVHATLAEPLAVAVRALAKVGDVSGRSVAVLGGGTIGILVAQAARAGDGVPLVVEPAVYRRDLCEALGIATVWDDDPVRRDAEARGHFPARGADVVVECSGRPGMANTAVHLVRAGGAVVLLGVLAEPEPIDTLDLVLGEKVVHGSAAHMYDVDVAAAVDLLRRGVVDVSRLVTHRFPLDQVERAFAVLGDPAARAIKVVIEP